MRTLDAIDLRLLDLLQTDARRLADDLAGEVPLSASAIAPRLRRLRESGAITAEVAILALSTGSFLSALVEVKLERHAQTGVEAFNAFADAELANDPAVQRFETRFVKRRRKFSTALPLSQVRP